MAELLIYGSSDDLVEVEGDLREEFTALDIDDGGFLAVSDGTLLRILYDQDGCWRITRIAVGMAEFTKKEAQGPDSEDYSDKVKLTGLDKFQWAVFGKEAARRKPETAGQERK